MRCLSAIAALLLAGAGVLAGANGTAAKALAAADDAWDRGDYVTALNGYIKLVEPAAVDDEVFEAIALKTGELFTTRELTADGRNPKFSPDGPLPRLRIRPRGFASHTRGAERQHAEASRRVARHRCHVFADDRDDRVFEDRRQSRLFNTYASFGYQPDYQWFDNRNALDGKTANVIATLRGTINPELVYVVSSHYDSVAGGPGADDDSSGTAALLEAARVLAQNPMPATIVFASFTGEESGLLGSREFVRQAVANKMQVVGALNNDMIGFANDQRLDNTIRYSNSGIRDIQHGAAMLFTRLITYDAVYFKGTDAAAYYDAYGDIVGGIGSYPVLSNPHYHQPHDLLEFENHELITETSKTTAATLMLLASSPSRIKHVKADRAGSVTTVTWAPAPLKGITSYVVVYGPASAPTSRRVTVKTARAQLSDAPVGTVVAVKAVNAKGLEGWDWARVTVQ